MNEPILCTRVDTPRSSRCIGYRDRILALGSCFSEHIGQRLLSQGYDIAVNPFGALYNPLSIASALERLAAGRAFDESELFVHAGLYHSFMHHGKFSAASATVALEAINTAFERAAASYRTATVLCLTWGTARAYRLKDSDRVVANCHKLPSAYFDRKDYSIEELLSIVDPLLSSYLAEDDSRIIVQTVSPIRHLGDGAHDNALSKARLLLFAETLSMRHPGRIFYFPAYELVLDELRDYRFYAEDMTHPSALAVRIIYDRFEQCLLDPGDSAVRREMDAFRRFEKHRSLRLQNGEDDPHRVAVLSRKQEMQKRYPYLCWGTPSDRQENEYL